MDERSNGDRDNIDHDLILVGHTAHARRASSTAVLACALRRA
jgi:hypothetical protein